MLRSVAAAGLQRRQRMTTSKIRLWLFRQLLRAPLSREERALYTGFLLDALDGAPVRDIILVNEQGELLVNGRSLTPEELGAYGKMAKGLLDHPLLKLIWDQIRYSCFKGGVSGGKDQDSILFYRTALWFGEQERAWLRLLAQDDSDGN